MLSNSFYGVALLGQCYTMKSFTISQLGFLLLIFLQLFTILCMAQEYKCIPTCGWSGKRGKPATATGLSMHQRTCQYFLDEQESAQYAGREILRAAGGSKEWKKRQICEVDEPASQPNILDRIIQSKVCCYFLSIQ